MTTPTTLPLRVFRAAAAAVEPFAGRRDTSIIGTVLLERTGNALKLTATDNAGQIGHVHLDIVQPGDDFTTCIPAGELRRAVAAFGPLRFGQATQVKLTVPASGRVLFHSDRMSVSVSPMHPGQFPRVYRSLADAFARPTNLLSMVTGVDPRSLVAYAKVCALLDLLGVSRGGMQMLQGTSGTSSPLSQVLIVGGDTFVGLLQPRRRRREDDEAMALWRGRLGVTA